MKKILRKFPETALIILALIFLGTIIWYFSWGTSGVIRELNRALNTDGAAGNTASFDIDGAKTLDLRGLVK